LKRHTLIFLLVNLFLASWYLDAGGNDNTMSRAATVAAITEHGTLRIDGYEQFTGDKAFIDGHWYSDKAPLPALIVTPFWWCTVKLGAKTTDTHGDLSKDLRRLAAFLCGTVPFAVMVTLLWLMLRERGAGAHSALLAMLPIYGSFLFVYTGSFNGHLLGAAFLLAAWRSFGRERLLLSGALCGAAVLSEFPLVFFPLAWSLVLLVRAVDRSTNWPDVLRFIAGGLPSLLLLLAYNTAITGSAFSFGYDHSEGYASQTHRFGLEGPSMRSLWGLTFSTYRGLFLYMPCLLLIPWALKGISNSSIRNDLLATWIPAIAVFLLIASTNMWWGGWAFGPRHLCSVGLFLVLPIAQAVAESRFWRWIFYTLCALGSALAFAAKSTVGSSLPTDVYEPITALIQPAIMGNGFNNSAWLIPPDAHPAWSVGGFLIIFVGALIILHRMEKRHYPAR
jgi:hypothetical protein